MIVTRIQSSAAFFCNSESVFSCAAVVVDGAVYVYYGGGEHVIGLATCALAELLEVALKG